MKDVTAEYLENIKQHLQEAYPQGMALNLQGADKQLVIPLNIIYTAISSVKQYKSHSLADLVNNWDLVEKIKPMDKEYFDLIYDFYSKPILQSYHFSEQEQALNRAMAYENTKRSVANVHIDNVVLDNMEVRDTAHHKSIIMDIRDASSVAAGFSIFGRFIYEDPRQTTLNISNQVQLSTLLMSEPGSLHRISVHGFEKKDGKYKLEIYSIDGHRGNGNESIMPKILTGPEVLV